MAKDNTKKAKHNYLLKLVKSVTFEHINTKNNLL
jgi:hypothetical protein